MLSFLFLLPFLSLFLSSPYLPISCLLPLLSPSPPLHSPYLPSLPSPPPLPSLHSPPFNLSSFSFSLSLSSLLLSIIPSPPLSSLPLHFPSFSSPLSSLLPFHHHLPSPPLLLPLPPSPSQHGLLHSSGSGNQNVLPQVLPVTSSFPHLSAPCGSVLCEVHSQEPCLAHQRIPIQVVTTCT